VGNRPVVTTYLSLEYGHETRLPDGLDEVRTPDALVGHALREYSDPGDRVIDPFAGLGTTLQVAEQLGRVPVGVEYDPDRVAYVRTQLSDDAHLRQGDARELDPTWVPTCDVAFTSPPFMERTDDRNPFEHYTGESSYDQYLDDLEEVFRRLSGALRPGARVAVDVANIKHEGRVTPLAWDVARRLSNVYRFDGETVVTWEGEGNPDAGDGRFGYGYDHSYCLVFTKTGG
jgi:SAM-dependent methyltransferase